MWQIAPAGDRALLVTLGRSIDPELLGQVLALDQALQDRRPIGLVSTVTAYGALLCHYDAAATDPARLEDAIRELEGKVEASIPSGVIVDIPTRYDGPDLPEVALRTNLTPADVIERHAGREYLVYCVGFAPGFTYCGAIPDASPPVRSGLPVVRPGSMPLRVPAVGTSSAEQPCASWTQPPIRRRASGRAIGCASYRHRDRGHRARALDDHPGSRPARPRAVRHPAWWYRGLVRSPRRQ